ncbi:brain acid soluble protein 1-like [Bombyx mandarina]|nr:uncharacterized protein LOC778506 isoform X2 [Bombyx mori]XP_028041338.1 brain acid soluble protein 1-like [Bombyx mandarina]
MKVLLLCIAFAAVSLAMPVAEEKDVVPAQPILEVAPKIDDSVKPTEVAAATEEKKAEPAPVSNDEVPAIPEAKKDDIAPEDSDIAKPETVPEVKTEEKVPEAKSSEIPDAEAKSADIKVEEPAAQPEDSKTEVQATVAEISKEEKPSATDAEGSADSAAIIPNMVKKIDLAPTVESDAAAIPEIKTPEAADAPKLADNPVDEDKPADISPDAPKAEAKSADDSATTAKDDIPVAPETSDDKNKETKTKDKDSSSSSESSQSSDESKSEENKS